MFKGGIIDIEKRLAVARRGRYSLSPPFIKSNNITHTAQVESLKRIVSRKCLILGIL